MSAIPIRDVTNKTTGQLELDPEVFGEKPKRHTVYEEVKRFLAAQRAGTHATKTRGEVSGGGKKLWKQKGTGRARMGSNRSPLWRHGGTVHGPQPRSYDLRIPRKVKKLAMRVALSEKAREDAIMVLGSLELSEPRTRKVADLVKQLELNGTALMVEESANSNLRLAARNHPQVKVVAPSALSVYEVLLFDRLILTPATAAKLVEIFRP